MLLGSAILGAVASGAFPDIRTAMTAMSSVESTFRPADVHTRRTHDRRYRAFRQLQETGRDLQQG